MKAEYINPFVKASTEIIEQVAGLKSQLGKIYVKDKPYIKDNVIVLIGLTGQISGTVVISFDKEVAIEIVSAMMMGMPVKELDDMAFSAIGELCNMILGNTVTLLSQKNISIDITPPSILTGDNMKLSVHKSIVVCVPLHFRGGKTVEIDISYEDRTNL